MTQTANKGKGRGFKSLSPERRREVASQGGKIAHQLGKAHKWSKEEAKVAGRLGGQKSKRGPREK